jgi:hypothetical protein
MSNPKSIFNIVQAIEISKTMVKLGQKRPPEWPERGHVLLVRTGFSYPVYFSVCTSQ